MASLTPSQYIEAATAVIDIFREKSVDGIIIGGLAVFLNFEINRELPRHATLPIGDIDIRIIGKDLNQVKHALKEERRLQRIKLSSKLDNTRLLYKYVFEEKTVEIDVHMGNGPERRTSLMFTRSRLEQYY
jgi:hypothetical protein